MNEKVDKSFAASSNNNDTERLTIDMIKSSKSKHENQDVASVGVEISVKAPDLEQVNEEKAIKPESP